MVRPRGQIFSCELSDGGCRYPLGGELRRYWMDDSMTSS